LDDLIGLYWTELLCYGRSVVQLFALVEILNRFYSVKYELISR